MKKLLLVGAAAALGASACAPELGSQPPADVVVAQFDPTGTPAVVPTPNDLAIDARTGLVNAPIDPNASAAQQEFTRDYLNSLNGFPTSASATAKIVDLDPSSVSADSVRVLDLLQGTPIATPEVQPTIIYDDAADQLIIRPPATGWPKGGKYAVALVAGEGGLKGLDGRPVVGSATWAFARSANPLVTCEDLTAPNCQTATELIPSTKKDPAERLADQTASALRLEQLRRAYKPLLDALEKHPTKPVKRDDVALLWTFSIVNQPEPTFDLNPLAPVLPFPNDLARVQENGKWRLNLPEPQGATAEQKQLIAGLNTLDGFSTTAPIVSENSDARGPLETGSLVDPNTLSTGALFIKLTNRDKGTQPNVKACIDCASSPKADGTPSGNPQQLQFVPQTPLDEQTTYAALLTTDVKDTRGRRLMAPAAFALLRLSAPLLDANNNSTMAALGVDNNTARLLEPRRQAFKPVFDALAAAGIPRSKIALGWPFTTQSTVSVLNALHGLPAQYDPTGMLATPAYLRDVTANYAALGVTGVKVFEGSAFFPNVLTGFTPVTVQGTTVKVANGTLNPAAPVVQRLPFLLSVPATAEGTTTGNFPVTIFAHGLTGNRTNAAAIVGALAKGGKAVIAVDAPFHGERVNCAAISTTNPFVGLDNTLFTAPDQACANPDTQRCDTDVTSATFGRCIAKDPATRLDCSMASLEASDATCQAAGQGLCVPAPVEGNPAAGKCEGGDFKRISDATSRNNRQPVAAGNILNLGNLFATRDNFRHHVIDTAQVVRILSSAKLDERLTALNGGTALSVDETKIDFVGQSLGGILGTLSVAATPEIHRAVLNVPGADPVGILLTSKTPRFVAARTQFLARLEGSGLKQGTPAFDNFIGLARTILDPADPQNAAYALHNSATAPADRSVLVQYIAGDEVTPNPQTQKLIDAANRNPQRKVADYLFTPPESMSTASRHGFLLDPSGNASVTAAAQTQVVNFLVTGNVTPATF